ncbi:FtsX-like permease family protein [Halosquirtibacter xylanolyticus]|uniref:FtsX-like permease family protein n=1 Tax=Halosquirtibacter xylanolyticus TaxID=3374599 RepID=UPI00374A208E|nr:FtsX-like permease family protein [Prolixibacteraceae bacterium]
MNLSFYIAKRYLFSKKKTKVINIISLISMIGLAVGTFALVITISVFNGFDNLIQSRFSSFDPPLRVMPIEGKVFNINTIPLDELNKISGVRSISLTVEENALLRYGKNTTIATVKGVDSLFLMKSGVAKMMIEGVARLHKRDKSGVLLGGMVASDLRIGFNFQRPLSFYFPKKTKNLSINITQSFRQKIAYPTGCFSIQADIDQKYVLVPLDFARTLMGRKEGDVSQLEVYLTDNADEDNVRVEMLSLLGNKFKVLNKYQQHDTYYKIMKGEKWTIFLILVFILFVASFNLIGSISMLMIDKKDDVAILQSMGANKKLVRHIFLYEGWLISVLGMLIGLVLGVILCYLQQEFGIVKLQGGGAFIVDAYPVQLVGSDILIISLTVTALGLLASWVPIRFLNFDHININEG